MSLTQKYSHRNALATISMVAAISLFTVPVYAADESSGQSSSKFHPVDDTKKAATAVGHGVKKTTKAIGHGFRDGARAVGHGARKVTRAVGHAFRDGAHKVTGKKDEKS